jgi:hypothetical protein
MATASSMTVIYVWNQKSRVHALETPVSSLQTRHAKRGMLEISRIQTNSFDGERGSPYTVLATIFNASSTLWAQPDKAPAALIAFKNFSCS